MGSSGKREGGVKIVQIETRYVETDAMNFRDVVQSLTGKNSSTAWVGSGSKAPHASVKSEEFQLHNHDGRNNSVKEAEASLSSMILKNTTTSFKDFDRLLYELPPCTEDLPWLVGR
ncbi:VQ motif-containing protein 1-like [Neltuma alba]|uniref:VQ motif-containing protein 1-like n=1 Tax=Neltuma alba TaxID=207710 RepID=UPI0010A4F959|nr:VQ motif-containing protein 1-like [Prosopis alba]